MPDRLAAILNAEADRRLAGEVVPPMSSVRVRRVPSSQPSTLRKAGPMLAAAVAVVAVALAAGQLRLPGPTAATIATSPEATTAPSPGPATPGQKEPELGTMPTPEVVQSNPQTQPPARVDVLAQADVEPGVTAYLVGFHGDEQVCVVQVVIDVKAPEALGGGAGGCGPAGPDGRQERVPGGPAFGLDRSFVAGTGRLSEQLLSTELPAGSAQLRLSAVGVATKTVPAYDAGSRWGGAAFVLTAWPSGPETRGEALGADGSVIATSKDDGIDNRDFDPAVWEAQARCLEREGITVDRVPGGGYSWQPSGRDLERSCLEQAKRTVPRNP